MAVSLFVLEKQAIIDIKTLFIFLFTLKKVPELLLILAANIV